MIEAHEPDDGEYGVGAPAYPGEPVTEPTHPVPVDALEDKDTQDAAEAVGLVAHTDRHPRLT